MTHMHNGRLEVVCGPMFSGKSEELIRRLTRARIARQRVGIFKPQLDDRYDVTDIVSHAGVRMPATPVASSADIARLAQGYDAIGIDEVQFFDEGVVEVAVRLADSGVRVVCAGLDTDFRRLPYGPMPQLLARAESVTKLQSVCHRCGGEAIYTQRLVNGRPAPFSGETVQIGALDAYEARCRQCYQPGAASGTAATG
jgi:thymidine kinase